MKHAATLVLPALAGLLVVSMMLSTLLVGGVGTTTMGSDPPAADCTPSAGTTVDASAMRGNQDAARLLSWLRGGDGIDLKGLEFSDEMIAGMFGNFQQESGVTFRITEGHARDDADNAGARAYALARRGLGVAQWTGGRGASLVDYAESVGDNWYDGRVQAQKLVDDLAGPYRRAYDGMRSAANERDAAAVFHEIFEVSADTDITGRKDHATAWLVDIKGAAGSVVPVADGCADATDAGGDARYGSVGGAPADRHDFGWMCSWGGICHDGDGLQGTGGSTRNFYTYNFAGYQCVWYAWNRLAMIHGGGWTWVSGNGDQIAGNAASAPGWEVSASPRPGDGVSFVRLNHVAVVEKVEKSGSGWRIFISEGNWSSDGIEGHWNEYNTRWVDQSEFMGRRVFFRRPSWSR